MVILMTRLIIEPWYVVVPADVARVEGCVWPAGARHWPWGGDAWRQFSQRRWAENWRPPTASAARTWTASGWRTCSRPCRLRISPVTSSRGGVSLVTSRWESEEALRRDCQRTPAPWRQRRVNWPQRQYSVLFEVCTRPTAVRRTEVHRWTSVVMMMMMMMILLLRTTTTTNNNVIPRRGRCFCLV